MAGISVSSAGISTVSTVGAGGGTLVVDRMAEVVAKGNAGEAMSGLAKNTERIVSLTGKAAYRIPDGLNHAAKILSEVKNYSGKLSYTSQLRDFVLYAQRYGYQFHLYTNAKLSGPLQQAVNSGLIRRFPLK